MGQSGLSSTLLYGEASNYVRHSHSPARSSYLQQPWRWLSGLTHEPPPIPFPHSGRQYWEYEFQQQPSQEECEGSSLSAVFEHFALLQRDSWETLFEFLFGNRFSGMEGGRASLAFSSRGLGSPG